MNVPIRACCICMAAHDILGWEGPAAENVRRCCWVLQMLHKLPDKLRTLDQKHLITCDKGFEVA
jgi:hypothetical protein